MALIISEADVRILRSTAERHNLVERFNKMIRRTRIVQSDLVPKTVVKLNSWVQLWHSVLKKVVRIRVVLPEMADLSHRNISVFAPISMAILGSRENDLISVEIAGIRKELKIIKVVNK